MITSIKSKSIFYSLNTVNSNYPVGSFVYSHGLEYLIENNIITNKQTLENYLDYLFFHSHFKQDIIFINQMYKMKSFHKIKIIELLDLYLSLNCSEELMTESLNTGSSFYKITNKIYNLKNITSFLKNHEKPYCIMYALFSKILKQNHEEALKGFVYATLNNLVSNYVKVKPAGQEEGQIILKKIFLKFEKKISVMKRWSLSNLSTFSLYADIASFKHERMYTRIYQS